MGIPWPHRLLAEGAMKRIPLIVLGGFLGAGKTTLLNHMLTEAHGRRIAVLVNDFGPINVDEKLIAEHDGETLSLTNGCICCSIGSGLDAALIQVLERDPAPELIVIEASGVSDPGRIAQVGLSDPMLQLEAVVVMVDVDQVLEQLDDPLLSDTLCRQIDSAGLLVLNKTDLVSAQALDAVKHRLIEQFGPTPVFETQHARVPVDVLSGQAARLDDLRRHGSQQGHNHDQAHASGHEAEPVHTHAHSHADEPDHPFEGGSWTGEGILNADQLIQTLKQLPRAVIRLKGWVVTDRHGPVIVHLAGRRVRFEQPARDRVATTGLAVNELVFIGLKDQGVPVAVAQALGALLPGCVPSAAL